MQADAVDHAFEEILSKHPCGIILDLHTCVGVEISSLRAAAWVIDKPLDAGIFFGRDQRSTVLHGKTTDVPPVTVSDAASFVALQKTLDTRGSAHITVAPDPNAFRGPVAILTSNRTSSSAELPVWLLKHSGRAKVYGEATAGRPLLAREVGVGQGWVLRIASQDFATPPATAPASAASSPTSNSINTPPPARRGRHSSCRGRNFARPPRIARVTQEGGQHGSAASIRKKNSIDQRTRRASTRPSGRACDSCSFASKSEYPQSISSPSTG